MFPSLALKYIYILTQSTRQHIFQYLESDDAGGLTTEDGSLLIKAALPRELVICQKLLYVPLLEALRPFIVKFLGALQLEGEGDHSNPTTANSGIVIKPIDDHNDECSHVIDLCIHDSVSSPLS